MRSTTRLARAASFSTILALAASCPISFGDYDNPVDPGSTSYQCFETIIAAASAWNGDCASSAPLFACLQVVGAESYHLQIATSPDFGEGQLAFEDASMASHRIETYAIAEYLSHDTTYYWHIRALKSVWGPWTDTRSFTFSKVLPPPVFDPPAGAYETDQVVTITCPVSDAAIRYTTDGTTPSSTVGTLIAGGGTVTVTVDPKTTLKATAYKSGWGDSSLTSGLYVRMLLSMVIIPAGTYQMGSTASSIEQPIHTVTLSSFRMSATEITQSQYQAVMGSNPSYYSGNTDAVICPVEKVSWYDALVFCNRLSMQEGLTPVYTISGNTDPTVWGAVPTSGNSTWNAAVMNTSANGYRLPTEAEWEFAARGGTATASYWGDSTADATVSLYAWYGFNSGSMTHEVAQKLPNAYGLYDMSGNVWEWCWDWYGTYPSGSQTDPVGPSSGSARVKRGGSWAVSSVYLRSAYRSYDYPNYRINSIGFRVVAQSGP